MIQPPKQKRNKNVQPISTVDNAKIYVIYILKFANSTTCDGISQHIISKTSLENCQQFNVAKIKHKTFCAFKVTVLKTEVHDLIMKMFGYRIIVPVSSITIKRRKPKNGQLANKSNASKETVSESPRRKETVSSSNTTKKQQVKHT